MRSIAIATALLALVSGSAFAQETPAESDRSLRGAQRVAAATEVQSTLRGLNDFEPQGVLELRIHMHDADMSSIGFVTAPGLAVFPLARTDVTRDELNRADLLVRTAYGDEEWSSASFVAHSARCGCFVVRLRDNSRTATTLPATTPFRGQVVWARGPFRSTLIGLVSNERELYLGLDMANRGSHYGPIFDLDGALVGVITHRISRADSELADVNFAIPATLMASEAAAISAR